MDGEAYGPLFLTLQRYAGWLDRDRASVAVRADVEALGTAIDAGVDPSLLLSTLDANIARLPSSGIRQLLRTTSRGIRRLLETPP